MPERNTANGRSALRAGSHKPSPRSAEHAEIQRQRILDAAEKAFAENGFHAASMAKIAEMAEISQGLAYRYFKNKNAIIIAIFERQLAERQQAIQAIQSKDHFVERVSEFFGTWVSRQKPGMNPILFLEMSAEATRNPEIAEAIARADSQGRRELKAWMRRMAKNSGKEVNEVELNERVITLQAFVEGLAVRAVREPQIDQNLIRKSARFLLPTVLNFV